jgi:hypothetical protein
VPSYSGSYIYHLFSFCGSLQDYKIHMDVEIVNTVHKSNKIICLKSQEVKSIKAHNSCRY